MNTLLNANPSTLVRPGLNRLEYKQTKNAEHGARIWGTVQTAAVVVGHRKASAGHTPNAVWEIWWALFKKWVRTQRLKTCLRGESVQVYVNA